MIKISNIIKDYYQEDMHVNTLYYWQLAFSHALCKVQYYQYMEF
jgi:hypothetical protein